MTNDDFNLILEARMAKMSVTLTAKAGEYAVANDRLSNFRRAASIQQIPPAQVALNFFMKHFVSVQDMVEAKRSYTRAMWDEKLGDMINYLVLLEAITYEPGLWMTVNDSDLPANVGGTIERPTKVEIPNN